MQKKKIIDQMQREVVLENVPQRIISLVPSQTEFLYDLGLGDRVVGITKFCIYPEQWFKSKTRIGGTKAVDLEKVKSLKPDLIIGNKEENTLEDIEALEKIAPVWMSDIYTFQDACDMMLNLGELCDLKPESEKLVHQIRENFSKYLPWDKTKSVMYLIWNEPLMACGKQTFIDDMLRVFGLKNFYENKNRYPVCVPDKEKQADYIFLSSEPFPFKEQHKAEIQALYPDAKIVFVDGEMFSWYGSRLALVPAYFTELQQEL